MPIHQSTNKILKIMVFKTTQKSRLNFGSKCCYYQTKTNGKRIEKFKSLLLPPLISPCSNNQSYLFVLFKSITKKKRLINKQTNKKNTKAIKGLPIHHEDWHGSPLSLLQKKIFSFSTQILI